MRSELTAQELGRLNVTQLVEYGRQALQAESYGRAATLFREAVRRAPMRQDLKDYLGMAIEGTLMDPQAGGRANPAPPPPHRPAPEPPASRPAPPAERRPDPVKNNTQPRPAEERPAENRPRPESRPSARLREPWPDFRSDPPPAPPPERRPEPRPLPRPDLPRFEPPRSDIRPGSRPEFRFEPRPESHPEPRPEARSEPRPEPRPGSRPAEARPQPQPRFQPPGAPMRPEPWMVDQPAPPPARPRPANDKNREYDVDTVDESIDDIPVRPPAPRPARPAPERPPLPPQPKPEMATPQGVLAHAGKPHAKPIDFKRRHERGPVSAILLGVFVGFIVFTLIAGLGWYYYEYTQKAVDGAKMGMNHADFSAAVERARIYSSRGEDSKAIDLLTGMPDSPERNRILADMFSDYGDHQILLQRPPRYEGAIQNYNEAIKYEPNSPKYRLSLAGAYLQMASNQLDNEKNAASFLELAKQNCDTVLKQDSKNIKALIILSRIALQKKDEITAAQLLHKIIDLSPPGSQESLEAKGTLEAHKLK